MFLLDTNVISELRKARTGKADPHVLAWAQRVPSKHLYISVITVLELEMGILQIERRDLTQGQKLRTWLEQQVLPTFDQRICDVDRAIARQCARFHVPNPCAERDALIAATAWVHGYTVVTRNTADFAATKVSLLNPWLTIHAHTK